MRSLAQGTIRMTDEKLVLAFSIRDACAAVGVGRTKLYALINEGKLDARAIGGRTVIPAASLRNFVANLPSAAIKGVK